MNKSDNAYKTIGEVVKILELKNRSGNTTATHTIRFWEKEFKQIKPKIFAGKRRYYDEKSIKIIKKIRFLLKEKGLTINGVKKFLINERSFNLDETSNRTINTDNLINKISNENENKIEVQESQEKKSISN